MAMRTASAAHPVPVTMQCPSRQRQKFTRHQALAATAATRSSQRPGSRLRLGAAAMAIATATKNTH
jgi:hypothetical protein